VVAMAGKKVIVVGAGIGGLSAAYWLSKKGCDVEIFEASNRPGGCVATIKHGVDLVDVGAQAFVSNNRYAYELLEATDLKKTLRKMPAKVLYTMKNGESCMFNKNLPFLKPLGLYGHMKFVQFILSHIILGKRFPVYEITKDIPEYDNIGSMEYFGKHSDASIRDYALTSVSMIENLGLPEWMSLYHLIHMVRNAAYYSFYASTLGNGALTDRLAMNLKIKYESPVQRIIVDKKAVPGVQIKGSETIIKADHIIVNAGPKAVEGMLPDELDEYRSFFKNIVCDGVPIPVFFLDRPLRKDDVWLYCSDPRLKRKFMYAWDERGKVPEASPSGKSTVIGWSGHPWTTDLLKMSDDAILKEARQDIEYAIPGFSQYIEDATVFRHDSGAIRYPAGSYRRIIEFQEKAKKMKGISFVSSLFGGAYMEAAI